MTLNNSSVFNDPQTDLAKIAARLQGFEAVLLTQQPTRFTREMLALAPSLKLISQTGPGTTHIDVAACTGHGVLVSAGGSVSASTAELTWGLILGPIRRY